MDNVASLRFFWPESVLTLASLSLFIQDLFTRRSPRRVQALTAGALVWLALAAYATWKTPGGTVPLFGGLLQHDPLRMFFAWVFLYGLLRTLVSFLRLDDIVFMGLRTAQLIGIGAMVFGLAGMAYLLRIPPRGTGKRAGRRRIQREQGQPTPEGEPAT